MADYVSPNLARDYLFAVSTDGVAYTTVSGVQNFMPSPSTNTTDITTFDTRGVQVDLPTSFKGELNFELIATYHTGATPYVQDVGQTILLEKAANLGVASRVYYRITHQDSTNHTGSALGTGFVSIDEMGGGSDGVDMIKGKISYDSRPVGTGDFANKFGAQN